MLLVQEQEKILYYAMGIRKKINKDIELFHNNYTSIPIDKNNICIQIGKDCQINDNVHIGAIKSVKIGKNVLIASKVFITDRNHKSYGQDESNRAPYSISVENPAIVIKIYD